MSLPPDRLADVLRIAQEAVARQGAERAEYLDTACGADGGLRREVEAVLAEQASGDGFLDTPPWQPPEPGLVAGQRVGPYEIEASLGAGGMGEVYKARDTRLDRAVAIKILPRFFSADPARRVRFEREARAIAGLNHPHICTLHDVGEHPSTLRDPQGRPEHGRGTTGSGQATLYLVMEFLEGQTLAARLEKGRLPLGQALAVAAEIAEALSAAHRQGIIHRDLKPANVMLTKSGAKLLDFGLAKLTGHGEQPAAAMLMAVPTQPPTLTGEGVIVGTLHYMAPEQLEGKPPDARTDLWALGAILYEMLTGKRAFEGASAGSLMGKIMNAEAPALSTLQPLTPPALDRLVRRCLAKSPDDRPDTAHDVADDLRWLRESSGVGAVPDRALVRQRRLGTTLLVACVALVLGAVVGGSSLWFLRPAVAPMVARLTLEVRPAEDLNAGGMSSRSLPTPGGSRTALAWTPDGRTLLFVGRRGNVQQLYARSLDAAEAKALPGTEGAQVPAVSPDGQWVAFWAAGAVKKAPLAGGPPMDVAAGSGAPPTGLVWDAHVGLVFSSVIGPISAIPANGGKPKAITTVGEREAEHALPSLLPGGRVLLYTVRKRQGTWGDEDIVAQVLATGERKRLLTDAADARYVPATGHLVFLRRGVLYAVAFDAERLEVLGTPTAMFDGMAQALTGDNANNVTGAGQFALATTGALAWLGGPAGPLRQSVLVTVDRRGQVAPLPAPVRTYGRGLRVSPDGRRLAVTVRTLTEESLWLYDLTRTTMTRLPIDGEANWPTWTPDSRQLVFRWLHDGMFNLTAQPADGTAPRVLLGGYFVPSSWARDGRTLAALDGGDVHKVTIADGTASVQPLWQTPHREQWPAFSPDGRWLVYGSNESGRYEIYVRPYPGLGTPEQVSIEGGTDPAWHPAGRELFFVGLPDEAGKHRMMSVEFVAGTPPRIGQPRALFAFDPTLAMACWPSRCYDVAPDGRRFYVVQTPTPPPPPIVTHVNLIQNWFEELKAKVPPAR